MTIASAAVVTIQQKKGNKCEKVNRGRQISLKGSVTDKREERMTNGMSGGLIYRNMSVRDQRTAKTSRFSKRTFESDDYHSFGETCSDSGD